jgi:hypothetical protein
LCKPIEKRETKLVIRSDTKFVPMLYHPEDVAGERRLACKSYRCVTISLDTCPNEDIEANPDKCRFTEGGAYQGVQRFWVQHWVQVNGGRMADVSSQGDARQ